MASFVFMGSIVPREGPEAAAECFFSSDNLYGILPHLVIAKKAKYKKNLKGGIKWKMPVVEMKASDEEHTKFVKVSLMPFRYQRFRADAILLILLPTDLQPASDPIVLQHLQNLQKESKKKEAAPVCCVSYNVPKEQSAAISQWKKRICKTFRGNLHLGELCTPIEVQRFLEDIANGF